MHDIKHFVESFPPGVFPLLAAALGLSAFQQKLHHWLSVQSGRIKMLISVGLSILIVLIPHWIGILQGNTDLLGAYSAEVLSGMTVFYTFLIKETPQINADLSPEQIVVPDPPVAPVQTPALPEIDTAADFETKA